MADFITCDSPPPDPDTLQTLIETNDMIRIALARFDAIKEAIEMSKQAPQVETQLVDSAARAMEMSFLEDPFRDPQIPPPLVYPSGRQSSPSPVATGRVTRLDTGHSHEPTSPVSPMVSFPSCSVERIVKEIFVERSQQNRVLWKKRLASDSRYGNNNIGGRLSTPFVPNVQLLVLSLLGV